MDYSSPVLLGVRNLARRVGVLPFLQHLWRSLRGEGYEENFEKALLSGIHKGDVVWDIGANVGLYSRKFSDLTGPSGKVVAFEPSRQTFVSLSSNVASYQNVVCFQIAVSDSVGKAEFFVTEEENSPVNGLAQRSDIPVGEVYSVDVSTGDEFNAQHPELSPNVMKIDVEGFEWEVLGGMKSLLHAPSLRAIYIEVHFTSLRERNLGDAPRQMVSMLKNAGFTVRWTDASHIEAVRRT